jgi:hypothetical protein
MTFAEPRSATQIAHDLPTEIFIIYESNEFELAKALKELFEHWGLGTFFCRQEIRGLAISAPYRRFLADELSKARVAIPLLSPSFRWSPYCQAEAGACATLMKPMIAVIIPPSTLDDVREMSPVLEGFDVAIVSPTLPTWSFKTLVATLKAPPNPHKWQVATFIDDLQSKLLQALGLTIQGQNADDAQETRLRRNVNEALDFIITTNHLTRPEKEALYIWPSIDDTATPPGNKTKPSLAPTSIIQNIKTSLLNPNIPTTALDFVGVSLKFSLKLITAALQELAQDQRGGIRSVSVAPDGKRKTLQITLVHMDDQAHILHALHDSLDIELILSSFQQQFTSIAENWCTACGEMGVELLPPQEFCIDYIPPRIGIMIDKSILYAGRCSFPQRGEEFHLRAGENEYFFYDQTTSRGGREIEEFINYLAVYKRASFYGVTLVNEPKEWIRELEHCVLRYPNISDVTLISQTCYKFDPLLRTSITRGLTTSVYVQDPDSSGVTEESAAVIRTLPARIRRMIDDIPKGTPRGVANIYYYRHTPSYRAVSIGGHVLGIQMYIVRPPEPGVVKAGELRLIVARHSAKYVQLHRELIDQFKNYEGVSSQPDISI